MNDVTLYTGDCAAIMAAHIADNSIDLTVTSPPYDNLRTYNGYTFDFEVIAAQLWRVTKPGGVVVWVVGDATVNGSETGTSFRQALHFMGLGFNLHDTMIYDKDSFRFPFPNRYHQVFEFMFVLSKGNPATFNPLIDRNNRKSPVKVNGEIKREQDGSFTIRDAYTRARIGKRYNIWTYAQGANGATADSAAFDQPAIFPEALARDHILSWSNPGDVVLDPMMGSGTTGKMALLHGRRFVGIDISAEYVALARRRIANVEAQPFLFHPAEIEQATQIPLDTAAYS